MNELKITSRWRDITVTKDEYQKFVKSFDRSKHRHHHVLVWCVAEKIGAKTVKKLDRGASWTEVFKTDNGWFSVTGDQYKEATAWNE